MLWPFCEQYLILNIGANNGSWSRRDFYLSAIISYPFHTMTWSHLFRVMTSQLLQPTQRRHQPKWPEMFLIAYWRVCSPQTGNGGAKGGLNKDRKMEKRRDRARTSWCEKKLASFHWHSMKIHYFFLNGRFRCGRILFTHRMTHKNP